MSCHLFFMTSFLIGQKLMHVYKLEDTVGEKYEVYKPQYLLHKLAIVTDLQKKMTFLTVFLFKM